MVRQIDIARKTGFSLGVVSRSLSSQRGKNDKISDETREKIRRAAQEMGYSANLHAASLRRGQTPAIRVLVPSWATAQISQLTMGIATAARELDLPLTLHYFSRPNDYLGFLDSMNQQKNTGVLFYMQREMDPDLLRKEIEAYRANGGKIIFMNSHNDGYDNIFDDMVSLNIDEEHGGALAAEYLLRECGCREFSVCQTPPRYSVLRCKGFVEALKANGINGADIFEYPMNNADFDYEDYRKVLEPQLEAYLDRIATYPHGIFQTTSKLSSLIAMKLIQRGVELNREVCPVRYDSAKGDPLPLFDSPCIIQPLYEMGYQALGKLSDMLAGTPVESCWLKPYLEAHLQNF